MSILVKYSKAQYLAKIAEIEGYHNQLKVHLERMQELKEHMFTFWNDPNAQKAGMLLANEIRAVQNAMDRTNATLSFYKTTVEKLDGADISAKELLEEAIGLLSL